MTGQSMRWPFYCSRCGGLYAMPDKLLACLTGHEDADQRMRDMQQTDIVVTVA